MGGTASVRVFEICYYAKIRYSNQNEDWFKIGVHDKNSFKLMFEA